MVENINSKQSIQGQTQEGISTSLAVKGSQAQAVRKVARKMASRTVKMARLNKG